MNKQVKKFGCLVLAMLTACSTFAGCKGDDSSSSSGDSTNTGVKKYDTENRAVVFATDALDGNFNPFFATSATDTTIAAMTQVIAICSFFFHIFPRTTSKSTSIFFPCVLL